MPHHRTTNRASTVAPSGPPRSSVSRLRTAFFAHAGELAHRYHITFERLIAHLWRARHAHRRLTLRSVTHVDDLVHAIACIDEVGMAWSDLGERYERALIRRCRGGQDEIEATILVRRLFSQLRCRTQNDSIAPLLPSLRGYAGTRPLRNWLADRLSATRARQATVRSRAHSTFDSIALAQQPLGPARFNNPIDINSWPDIAPLKFVSVARPAHVALPACPAITHLAE